MQAWRLEAEGFKPATEEQLEAFLDTAPNKELKRQYEKKLRQLMETGRKEKEKLRGPHVDVPLVLDDESWKRLLSLAEAARTAVARQQAGVDEEDVRFLALLTAIEYGAPPAASVPPFVHNVAVRSKNAALHVRRCTADIRDKVASAASDYLSYLEDPSLPTVMDFDDLLTHLRHTCQIIASLPLLNIRYTSIEWDSSSSSAAAPAISYPGSSSCSAAPTISHDTRTRKKQSLGR